MNTSNFPIKTMADAMNALEQLRLGNVTGFWVHSDIALLWTNRPHGGILDRSSSIGRRATFVTKDINGRVCVGGISN